MKITVLIENRASGELCCEHGLSIYIEHYGKNYLLDTGASGADVVVSDIEYFYEKCAEDADFVGGCRCSIPFPCSL